MVRYKPQDLINVKAGEVNTPTNTNRSSPDKGWLHIKVVSWFPYANVLDGYVQESGSKQIGLKIVDIHVSASVLYH